MRKLLVKSLALVLVGLILVSCSPPPPLKSDKYLKDNSLLQPAPSGCTEPCFHGITPGVTTFTDAVAKIKADTAFSDVQTQDKPPAASWSAADTKEACCQLSANPDTGLVNAILVKVAPKMFVKDVMDKYGDPKYVNAVDYSDSEVAVALIYPEKGVVTWINPGNKDSKVDSTSPVVMVLYIDPKDWSKVLDQATLQAWNGFLPYAQYKGATPVVTPRVTATPQ